MMKINEKTIPLNTLRTSFNLKSFINILKIWFLIIPLFTLDAKEPTILMLKNSYSNSLQEFQTAPNYSFSCKPYGIRTFDEILSTNKSDKRCRQLLKTFYIKHPKLYSLHHRYLHRKSFYHVEYINNSCLVYAKGKTTFSEILLKEGMAFVDKSLENKILKPKFISLQNYAKDKKKGVFSDSELMNCVYGN
jgi:hypothetical protein